MKTIKLNKTTYLLLDIPFICDGPITMGSLLPRKNPLKAGEIARSQRHLYRVTKAFWRVAVAVRYKHHAHRLDQVNYTTNSSRFQWPSSVSLGNFIVR